MVAAHNAISYARLYFTRKWTFKKKNQKSKIKIMAADGKSKEASALKNAQISI